MPAVDMKRATASSLRPSATSAASSAANSASPVPADEVGWVVKLPVLTGGS